jgi:hypothetical protein
MAAVPRVAVLVERDEPQELSSVGPTISVDKETSPVGSATTAVDATNIQTLTKSELDDAFEAISEASSSSDEASEGDASSSSSGGSEGGEAWDDEGEEEKRSSLTGILGPAVAPMRRLSSIFLVPAAQRTETSASSSTCASTSEVASPAAAAADSSDAHANVSDGALESTDAVGASLGPGTSSDEDSGFGDDDIAEAFVAAAVSTVFQSSSTHSRSADNEGGDGAGEGRRLSLASGLVHSAMVSIGRLSFGGRKQHPSNGV